MKLALFLFAFAISQICSASTFARMAVMGDSGEVSRQLRALKASLQSQHVSSMIMPGDNLYSGTYEKVWDDWKKTGFKFDVVAIGNHNGGYAKEVKYFGMGGEFYSTVKNGVRFLVLNSDNKNNVDSQFQWLEKEIQSANEELIFLVYHHPTFTISKFHSWTEKRAFQTRMRKFYRDFGSRLAGVIIGHDHQSSFIEFGNIPAIVAGSGREVRDAGKVSYLDDGFQVETKFLASKTQHYAVMDIENGSKIAKVTFYQVSPFKEVCSAWFKRGQRFQLDPNCPN
jgi:predicted phosphodiesterase